MSVKPLRDMVYLERADEETQTPGGVYLPDRAKLRQARGKVLAVGPLVESDIEAGDTVYFRVWSESNAEIKDEGEKHLLVEEKDLLAVVTKTSNSGEKAPRRREVSHA